MTDIVRGVMAEEGLFTDCVPNMYRIQDVFGTSRCFCARCSRVWTSHMTWVKFDLRSQRILKNWKQTCMVCSSPVNPFINSEELERMAKLAVERCVSLTSGTFVLRSSGRRTPPHNTLACEKCREGGRPCWIIKQKSSSPRSLSVSEDGSQASDLETISDDLGKLMLTSDESSVANSRSESPHSESDGSETSASSKPYRHNQHQRHQRQHPNHGQQQGYTYRPVYKDSGHYLQPGTVEPGVQCGYSPVPSPVYYQQPDAFALPQFYQQTPVFSAVPPQQWYY